jgi:hypothetical protein
MVRRLSLLAFFAALPLAAVAQPRAPPGIPADENAPVVIRGRVVGVDWDRPRVAIHVIEEGTDQTWLVEGGTRNTLLRGGLSQSSLVAGRVLSIKGLRAVDRACEPECLAIGRDITFINPPPIVLP